MSTFKSFEDIEAWRKARILSKRIYHLTNEGTFARDFKLRDQINGSSGSIMDNISEGFERDGSKEFIQFLAIAKGSAGELKSQLLRALDRQHISQQIFNELSGEVGATMKLISGLIHYLKKCGMRGNKFHA